MDVGSSFTYVFEDEDWVPKILIGAALGLIPIVGGFFQMGFAMDAMKRTIDHTPTPLPEWDEWGDKLVKGLIATVILLVYHLPFILITGCLGGGGIALASGSDRDTAIIAVAACVGCLSLVFVIAAGLLAPAAIARYANTGEFGAAFQFGEVFSMVRNNIATYVIVLVMTLVAFLVGLLGGIVCVIGMWVTVFYAQLIIAYLYGSAYNVAMGSTSAGEAVL
jgi:hypothetical protein